MVRTWRAARLRSRLLDELGERILDAGGQADCEVGRDADNAGDGQRQPILGSEPSRRVPLSRA